jgi:hypothetical protein
MWLNVTYVGESSLHAGNLQHLSIPEWKWEDIYVDFIMGLRRTSHGHDSIGVIVDRLMKSTHFIPVGTRYRVRQYAKIYISHIIRYHGIPKTIISDRGSIFVAHFWEQLHYYLGTHLICISAYHPQTDGPTERVSQIIEDMFHACVLSDGPKWDTHLPLVEFSYNIGRYCESYLWSRYCDIGRRECEVDSCQCIDYLVSAKELHQQETSSHGV